MVCQAITIGFEQTLYKHFVQCSAKKVRKRIRARFLRLVRNVHYLVKAGHVRSCRAVVSDGVQYFIVRHAEVLFRNKRTEKSVHHTVGHIARTYKAVVGVPVGRQVFAQS